MSTLITETLIVPVAKSDLLKRVFLTCTTKHFLLSYLFVQQFATDLLQGKADLIFIQCFGKACVCLYIGAVREWLHPDTVNSLLVMFAHVAYCVQHYMFERI